MPAVKLSCFRGMLFDKHTGPPVVRRCDRSAYRSCSPPRLHSGMYVLPLMVRCSRGTLLPCSKVLPPASGHLLAARRSGL
ncbi:hypothetical protein, partial [Phocaeicola coprocola]|uniref:hypothetical protein n=1 Tax=Phocaeicola coprocola TaxID=310298 RepID=UPI003A8DCD7B